MAEVRLQIPGVGEEVNWFFNARCQTFVCNKAREEGLKKDLKEKPGLEKIIAR